MPLNPTPRLRESQIEARLVAKTHRAKGLAIKLRSVNANGLPDRLLLFPGARIVFVECKAPGEVPTKLQAFTLGVLRALGFATAVIDSYAAVDALIALYTDPAL